MPVQVLMPAVSQHMTTGRLTRWLVRPGDRVAVGDVIAEVETGNVTMEVEAVDGGVIGALLVAAGKAEIGVGAPIATLVAGAPSVSAPSRRRSSPLARRLARAADVDLDSVPGSGPDGRIVKRDVEAAIGRSESTGHRAAELAAASQDQHTQRAGGGRAVALHAGERLVEIVVDEGESSSHAALPVVHHPDRCRAVPHGEDERRRASLLELAARAVPQFVLRFDCRMEAVERARARMNGGIAPRTGKPLALTDTDFVVKALALALQQVPEANVSWSPDAMLHHTTSDVAVIGAAVGSAAAVIVRDAEVKSLNAISDEIAGASAPLAADQRALAQSAGGSMSVHVLRSGSASAFECMVMPPQSGALALGPVETRPVVGEDGIVAGRVVSCALVCDQRAIGPAAASALVSAFKSLIEDPLRMLV
ncbi:MAG: 2-oxo acid dehydrogenase subunit E2 [Hyphomicrobiaceae bacterium]